MKIEYKKAVNEIKDNPHYSKELRWAVRDHCENKFQMLLDALKKYVELYEIRDEDKEIPHMNLWYGCEDKAKEAIEAAEWVEID